MMIFTTSAPPNRFCIGLGPGADQVLSTAHHRFCAGRTTRHELAEDVISSSAVYEMRWRNAREVRFVQMCALACEWQTPGCKMKRESKLGKKNFEKGEKRI